MQTSTLLLSAAAAAVAVVAFTGGNDGEDIEPNIDDGELAACTRVVLSRELLASTITALEQSGLSLSSKTSGRTAFYVLLSAANVSPVCLMVEDTIVVLPDGREVSWYLLAMEVDDMSLVELEEMLGVDLTSEPERPLPPVPTPDPVHEGEGEGEGEGYDDEGDGDGEVEGDGAPPPPDQVSTAPRNLFELGATDELESWAIGAAVEPTGEVLQRRRVVMLGYDDRWPFRPAALARMRQLARANPGVSFVLVPFALTRSVAGVPEDSVAYVLTAIDPDGRARPDAIVKRRNGAPLVSNKTWNELVRYAKHGPNVNEPLLRAFEGADGHTYVVRVVGKQGAFAFEWRWKVYRAGEDDSSPLETGSQATRGAALDAGRTFVRGIG